MEQYLRPETLFGTKFEGYLNDAKRKSISKSNAVGSQAQFTEKEIRKYANR